MTNALVAVDFDASRASRDRSEATLSCGIGYRLFVLQGSFHIRLGSVDFSEL